MGYQGLSLALKFQAAARCSSSLPIAATARRHNSASQAGSSPTESLSPVTTTRRSITEGSFEQWKQRPLKRRRRAWFHFQLLTAQCAIEIRTFVVLHYYISIFV